MGKERTIFDEVVAMADEWDRLHPALYTSECPCGCGAVVRVFDGGVAAWRWPSKERAYGVRIVEMKSDG